MPYDPAGELEKLAAAHDQLADSLRQAAATVRHAVLEARLVTVRIESTSTAGAGKVRVQELPAAELYKGLTICGAAEAFVKSGGRPITEAELFEALKARGVNIDSPATLADALRGCAAITFRKGHGWIIKTVKPKPPKKEILSPSELKVGTLDDVKQFFRKKIAGPQQDAGRF